MKRPESYTEFLSGLGNEMWKGAVIGTFPNLLIKQTDKQTSILAAELRAKYTVKTPDALFLATAILENVNVKGIEKWIFLYLMSINDKK